MKFMRIKEDKELYFELKTKMGLSENFSVKKDRRAVEQILANGGTMEEDQDNATLTSSICLSMTCGYAGF